METKKVVPSGATFFLFLFKPIRVPFLPVPAIPDHLIDPVLSTPAKFALGFRGVRVYDRNVAGTAVINDIRNLDAIHTFKGFYELQNAVALPCSKVVHCEIIILMGDLPNIVNTIILIEDHLYMELPKTRLKQL